MASLQGSGIIVEEWVKMQEPEAGNDYQESVLWTQQSSQIYKLTMVGTACKHKLDKIPAWKVETDIKSPPELWRSWQLLAARRESINFFLSVAHAW